MSSLLQRRPSPAMVVAVIALVAALGGTATAAFGPFKGDKIIKKHSLSGNRLKNGTITGKQVNLSKLGKVPSAATADSASNATNATNATNVDGMQLTSFTYAAANGSTKAVVLNNFDGLTLKASCTSGANNGLTVYANSSLTGATISWSDISKSGTGLAGGSAKNDAYASMPGATDLKMMNPGGTVDTGNGTTNIGYAVGQIVYSQPAGSRVTVDWSYENNVAGHDCYFTGTVVGAPSGPSASAVHASGAGGGSTASDRQRQAARG